MTTDTASSSLCSNETISMNGNLTQNDQLWKIVEKQRSIIQDLQEELSRVKVDRDNLLTQLEAARQQLVQLDKCDGRHHNEIGPVEEDDQAPLGSSQSSSSCGSSSNSFSSGPVPPPRSPYRQHSYTIDSQDGTVMAAVVRPARSMDETVMEQKDSPQSPSSAFKSNKSRPISPTKTRSPVSVILDKDAQVFARYQESLLHGSRKEEQQQQQQQEAARIWSPPPPRPPSFQQQQHHHHHRHVRRASSQPAISHNPPPPAHFAVHQDEMPSTSKIIENALDQLSVKVLGSNITTNHKGKGVVSFTISVQKSNDELWQIEKLYSDFLALDAQLKSLNKTRSRESKVNKLPDKALFATHAPNKANQRKLAIEKYLQHVVDLPWQNLAPLCEFLSSNKVDRSQQPKSSVASGYKEGYLTKRSKNFRGWKTRYFVLQNYVLNCYESKNGALVDTIHVPDTQIVRHHTPAGTPTSNDAAHAFMIVEPKKASLPGSGVYRHILCAESDAERDEWIEALTRCQFATAKEKKSASESLLPKHISPSTSTSRKISKDDIRPITAVPLSKAHEEQQHSFDSNKLSNIVLPPPRYYHPQRSNSDTSVQPDESAISISDTADSILTSAERPPLRQRSSMDQAYLTSKQNEHRRGSLGQVMIQSCRIGNNSSSAVPQSPTDESSGVDDKRKKAGRRTFWTRRIFTGDNSLGSMSPANGLRGFLSRSSSDSNSTTEPVSPRAQCATPSPLSPPILKVFGVPLEEAVKKSKISPKCELPAIVYRCIEYLEAKKATQEEGIYRLSGSAVKIRSLKQQFDSVPDFNLLESGEYHDIHAVAGVLKMWLRELPENVLTQELLGEFIPIIDLVDRQERVNELGRLVSMLPLANYTLLRVLCAHLIRVVQYSETNKMNVRNVGIIFSPTLKIPSSIFSLFLSEFEYIFWTNDTPSIPGYSSSSAKSMSTDDDGSYFATAAPDIHPTEQVPPNTTTPNTAPLTPESPPRKRILRDDQGRNNRNSVHYMDSVPLSMVGLEKGNAIVTDDEEDVEDLEIEDSSVLEEDIKDEDNAVVVSKTNCPADPPVSEK